MVKEKTVQLKIGRQTLSLSRIDKVLYPKTGFTKGEMIDYYGRIAKVMIPHLRGRPLTLKRYPEGVEGPFFYEKECPRYHPPWVQTATVERQDSKDVIHYCTLDDAASLVWVANLASIELHILLSQKKNVHCPTSMAFDLDPGPGMTLLDCAWAAMQVRAFFDALGLQSFPKTSGKKGLHVYVPLNDPKLTFENTKTFAHAVALTLEKQHPNRLISNMRKSLREGKIFIDWSQNDAHKTTVAAYSLRAADHPTVSTPVTWEELEQAIKKQDPQRLVFTTEQVLERVKKQGDLFAPVLRLRQHLPLDEKESKTSSPSKDLLKPYRQKRHFEITPEPRGKAKTPKGELHFVIQKHAASHLHYDFRLEAEGVLKSWAVPKGPSTHPQDKRLAMRVEDHPIDYENFEGIIPKGQYGGGTVMVWDRGTYINLTQQKGQLIPLSAGLAKGHIDFWLQGQKLNGAWSLVRMGGDEKHWLLIKKQDEGADFPPEPVRDQPNSALTRRSMEEIAADKKSKVWISNRAA